MRMSDSCSRSSNPIPVLTAIENVELEAHLAQEEADGTCRNRAEAGGARRPVAAFTQAAIRWPEAAGGHRPRHSRRSRSAAGGRADRHLDAAWAQEVLTLLVRLNKEFNKTIVMATHDPHAPQFATVVRILEKGELLPLAA